MAIRVNFQGGVEVKAPKKISREFVDRFVASKILWIQRQQKRIREIQAAKKHFVEGERFLFLGNEYPLVVSEGFRQKLAFTGQVFEISKLKLSFARLLFTSFYKQQAQIILSQRMREYASLMRVSPKKMRITSATTRWGSCSNAGTVNFSYRLILTPEAIINYVVVHELAHLTRHDHSKNFWQEVEKFYPNYKQARAWLKRYSLQIPEL